MTLSILFIGDPHIKTDNIPETDLLIKNILRHITEKQPDICIIGGDVMHYHEKLYTVALNKSHEMIKKISNLVKTFVLVGNHDMINNQQFLSENHWMNSMKGWQEDLIIVDTPIHYFLNGYNLVMCPYVYPGRFVEALERCKSLDDNENYNWKESDCIFAHQEFKGCKMGAITSELGDLWLEEYPRVVSGHIHNNQSPQKNIYYPGASMQQAFGETDDCVLALITLKSGEELKIEELELDMPKKRIISLDMSKIDDFKMKETTDKIRLTLSGDYDEFKSFKKTDKFKKLTEKGVKVVFRHKKIKKEKKEDGEKSKDITDFGNILAELVNKSKNINLIIAYEYIINNKKLQEDDILII